MTQRYRVEGTLDGNTCWWCVMYHGHVKPMHDWELREFLAYMVRNCEADGGCRCGVVKA